MGESEGLSEDRTSQLCIALTAGVVVQLGLFKRFQGTTSWSLRPGTRRALPCPCVAIPIGPPHPGPPTCSCGISSATALLLGMMPMTSSSRMRMYSCSPTRRSVYMNPNLLYST